LLIGLWGTLLGDDALSDGEGVARVPRRVSVLALAFARRAALETVAQKKKTNFVFFFFFFFAGKGGGDGRR